MDKRNKRNLRMLFSIIAILSTLFLSVLNIHAQYSPPYYTPYYFPSAAPYYTPLPNYLPWYYSPSIFQAYRSQSYYPYHLSWLNSLPRLNTLYMSLPPIGFPAAGLIPYLSLARGARQLTTTSLPSTTTAASALTDTALSVLIASLLINTGNPQVQAVLNLIASDPSLLNDLAFLNSLINTGNPQVAYVLALLASGVI